VIVLSQAEVRELLDLDELIDALADAHRELSPGKASMPPRIAERWPPTGAPSRSWDAALTESIPRNIGACGSRSNRPER
jgi:ornithine cyclodeaminase/alanine dehydrogenase-like protein (mu-crystallin family)